MKLFEAMLHMRSHKHLVAVYDEAIAHLCRLVDEDLPIPVGDERADAEYVETVLGELNTLRAVHMTKIEDIEGLEISDGKSDNNKPKRRKRASRARAKS
jgi:hypothetical protein